MELMDRKFQLELLTKLAAVYPEAVEPHALGIAGGERKLVFTVAYLHELGLLQGQATAMPLLGRLINSMSITARGLDFLEDDGGLSAKLSVVNVRLEADTIRKLIDARLDREDVPQEERSRISRWLDSAGSEGLSEAARRLVGEALDRLPDAIRLLGTQIS